jgi:hypothetical protein
MGVTEGFRDSAANLRREARLAGALAAARAPVPAPLGGPYEAAMSQQRRAGAGGANRPGFVPEPARKRDGSAHRAGGGTPSLDALAANRGKATADDRARRRPYESARSTCRVS